MSRRKNTSISRRGFIAGLASVSLIPIARPGISGGHEKRFRTLSARLTGFPEEAFDPVLARDMMHGLQATGDGAGLERLLSGKDQNAGDDDLARRIAVAWYSGIHPTAEGARVRTFRGALVWRSLDITKPPGDCSAEPGDWARQPVRRGM